MANQYDVTKAMLQTIKNGCVAESKSKKKRVIREGEYKEKEVVIAITNDARFGNNVLQNQIDSFKSVVSAAAKFAQETSEEKENNPLVYYPNTGNVVFSGSIPSLSGLRFQFSLNDITASPYIFVDGLALTEDTVQIINKIRGYYKNWVDSWNEAGDLLEKLKNDDEIN